MKMISSKETKDLIPRSFLCVLLFLSGISSLVKLETFSLPLYLNPLWRPIFLKPAADSKFSTPWSVDIEDFQNRTSRVRKSYIFNAHNTGKSEYSRLAF